MSSPLPVTQPAFDLHDIISAYADMASCMGDIAVPRHPDASDQDDLSTDHQVLILYNSLASRHSMQANFSEAIAELGKSINWPASSDHSPFDIAAHRHHTPIASLQFDDLVDPELLKRAFQLKNEIQSPDWSKYLGLESQPSDSVRKQTNTPATALERTP